jgi:hypothetical protein
MVPKRPKDDREKQKAYSHSPEGGGNNNGEIPLTITPGDGETVALLEEDVHAKAYGTV